MATFIAVAASALAGSGPAGAASQGAGMMAMAVEAYATSKAECDYKPEVGRVLKQLEDYFSEQVGDEWEALRAEAPRQLRAATNIAIISGAKAANGVVLKCGIASSVIGQALLLSAGALTPDPAIMAEANRLMNSGAPPKSGAAAQAPGVEAPQMPQSTSGYYGPGAGTNMGPGYRSTYGRPAGVADPTIAMVAPKPAPVAPHGRLAYGGRNGQEVDITSISGLDSEHAMIGIHNTRANAVAACIGLEKRASPQCISSILAMPFRNAVYADCKTGVIVDFFGRKYRFEGPTPPQSEEGGGAKYRIENLASSEILADTTADGYRHIMRLYQDLCPITAPSDL